MWITRDKSGYGGLRLWTEYPERGHNEWKHKYSGDCSFHIEDSLFPNVTWEDEPFEVELVSKDFIDNWRKRNPIDVELSRIYNYPL